MARPPIWPTPPAQAWYPQQVAYPQQPPVSVAPVVAGLPPQQPLFPIQNVPTPMTSAPANMLQTSFPMAPPGVPSPVAPQVSQPLFPVNTSVVNGAASSPFVASVAPGTIPASSPAAVGYGANNQGKSIFKPFFFQWCSVLHSYVFIACGKIWLTSTQCTVEFV